MKAHNTKSHALILLKYLSWRFIKHKNQRYFALCLLVGATLMSSLGFLSLNVQQTLNRDIADFLGAPLVISSPTEAPAQWWRQSTLNIKSPALTASFTYGAIGNSGYRSIALKAVSDNYPLQKPLIITFDGHTQQKTTAEKLGAKQAWLDQRAMHDFNVSIGDHIYLGQQKLTVTATIIQEPDRLTQLQHLLPRVMVSLNELSAIGVQNSQLSKDYRYLFDDQPTQLSALENALPSLLKQPHTVIKPNAGNHPFSRMAQRADNLMGFMMILIMLLCGSAAAIVANKIIARFIKPSAIMRCMGIKRNAFSNALIVQLSVIVLFSCIAGNLLGWAVQPLLSGFLAPHLNITDFSFDLSIPLMVTLITLLTIYALILPKLLGLDQMSVIKVLRGELDLSKKLWLTSVSLALSVFVLLWYFSDNTRLTIYLFVGLLTIVLCSIAIGYLINIFTTQFHRVLRGRFKVMLRSLGRNPTKHLSAMTTIALSVLAIIMINTLRGSFIDAYQIQRLNNDGQLLFSQLPQQHKKDFIQFTKNSDISIKGLYPTVNAQLVAVNGQSLDEGLSQQSDSREELRSPVKLSWSKKIPDNNILLEGKWPQTKSDGVSVEQEVMSDLGLNIGDTLTFDVAGQTFNSTITSRRSYKSGGSRFMFWFMFSADTLTPYAYHYMGGIDLDKHQDSDKTATIGALNSHFPQVLFINLSDVIARTASIMQSITNLMYLLLIVLLCAALTVIGASALVMDNPIQQHLMRTFGVKRSQMISMSMSQQGIIGSISCLIGIITAQLVAGVIFDQMFAMPYQANIQQNIIISISTVLCFVVFGLCLGIKREKASQSFNQAVQ